MMIGWASFKLRRAGELSSLSVHPYYSPRTVKTSPSLTRTLTIKELPESLRKSRRTSFNANTECLDRAVFVQGRPSRAVLAIFMAFPEANLVSEDVAGS